MDNIMLDLETWNNEPTAVVIQCAAIKFDPKTGKMGEIFNVHIDAEDEMANGFTVGANTLYWWFNQSEMAQVSAVGPKNERMECKMAWLDFNLFCKGVKNIWSHASFDAAIVIHHMKTLDITPLYSFRAMKDLRTAQLFSGIDPRPYKNEASGPLHDAVVDCKVQIAWFSDAFNRIEGKSHIQRNKH